MHSSLLHPRTWLLLALTTLTTTAQNIKQELSFGTISGQISPNGRAIPGWSITSSNHHVQILSDRVILTPPVPGNARGAMWTDNKVESTEWSAELAFRTSGQDTGSGNLQFWFVKDKNSISVDSVYTAGNFDGLVLVLDQYGGRGGGIRGFLNDGTQNFRSHSSLESLAFGHCDYHYRNLGRPSTLRVTSQNGLRVTIDDKECFSSNKISLPSDYQFGITAATADQPDSFEIQKFIVTSPPTSSGGGHTHDAPPPPPQNQDPLRRQESPQLQKLDRFPGSPEAVPDRVAEDIKSQSDQFADLHNRLQGLTHQVANIFAEFEQLGRKLDERHNQILGSMPGGFPTDKIETLGRRVESMEKTLEQVKRDVEGKDYREHLNQLNAAIENVRGGITDSLSPDSIGRIIKSSAPRMGMFIFVVVAVQLVMAGAYVFYKRRRAQMPKKYL